jgi:hypothetical protein
VLGVMVVPIDAITEKTVINDSKVTSHSVTTNP